MEFVAGVDLGGMFTDLIMVDGETQDACVAKVSSTPGHQAEGVMAGPMVSTCAPATAHASRVRAMASSRARARAGLR
jgi:N-methylhydantoinase A/oxoprolinase/acetone carboxylase beta subunit